MKKSLLYSAAFFLACLIYWRVGNGSEIAGSEERVPSTQQIKALSPEKSATPVAPQSATTATPLSADQYSGKTIDTKKLAYEVITHHTSNAPRVGEMAPDFSLKPVSGGRKASLSDLRETNLTLLR